VKLWRIAILVMIMMAVSILAFEPLGGLTVGIITVGPDDQVTWKPAAICIAKAKTRTAIFNAMMPTKVVQQSWPGPIRASPQLVQAQSVLVSRAWILRRYHLIRSRDSPGKGQRIQII
jgi:hypothetical protein